jgi:hypothetical protein
MSDQRPEVGDRSAVKTQLTSVLLECPLIVLLARSDRREPTCGQGSRAGVTFVDKF